MAGLQNTLARILELANSSAAPRIISVDLLAAIASVACGIAGSVARAHTAPV